MAKAKGAGSEGDPKLDAVQAVYRALRELKADERLSVLNSVTALLDMPGPTGAVAGDLQSSSQRSIDRPPSTKKLSVVELVDDKHPSTNSERIAVFPYYRENIENQPQFERDDLRPYFTRARLAPPTNYDRDFVNAVGKGWIHEDGANSYLTNKGAHAVEAGFGSATPAASGRRASKRSGKSKSSRRKVKRTSRRKGRS